MTTAQFPSPLVRVTTPGERRGPGVVAHSFGTSRGRAVTLLGVDLANAFWFGGI